MGEVVDIKTGIRRMANERNIPYAAYMAVLASVAFIGYNLGHSKGVMDTKEENILLVEHDCFTPGRLTDGKHLDIGIFGKGDKLTFSINGKEETTDAGSLTPTWRREIIC